MADLRDFTGKNRRFTGTDSMTVTSGTTGERYANAPVGSIRFNTTTAKIECKTSATEWSETNM